MQETRYNYISGVIPTCMMGLAEIKDGVIECTKCQLCRTRTNAVPGKGSAVSDVVFVGEAPGRNEDAQGEPFVGAAGRRLTDALEKIGVSRDSVYITNIVKCRPPDNRVPKKEERDACISYLDQEIAAINPKLVCIMGNTAFGSMLGGSNITRYRGKIIQKDGRNYFITIHPAATIYNQGLIQTLNDDIAAIFKTITELKEKDSTTTECLDADFTAGTRPQ